MSLLPDLPRIQNAVELLDGPASLSELEANFRDISRLNRYFGGSWVTRSHLVRLLGGRRGGGGGGRGRGGGARGGRGGAGPCPCSTGGAGGPISRFDWCAGPGGGGSPSA